MTESHTADFLGWLRGTWTVIMRAAEAIEPSPTEDMFDRLDRLEREIASLKKRKTDDGLAQEIRAMPALSHTR